MIKKSLLIIALAIPIIVSAQQQPDIGQGGKQPPMKKDLDTAVPIIRGMVKDIVDEAQAKTIDPRQVNDLKVKASAARQAYISEYPNGFIPEPVIRTFNLGVDSNESPRLVRLAAGSITSFVFTDTFGNPWFIKSSSIDCNLFTDGERCEGSTNAANATPTNILKIQPRTPYAYGNIVIELEDLAAPIIFMVSAGQSSQIDVRIDARIAGRNPSAKPQAMVFDRMPESDSQMGFFLDGVAPSGAKKLNLIGGKAEAWELNGAMYVRTRLTILSPAFKNHSGNADGQHVYKYDSLFSSLFASSDGKTTALTITGY